MPSLGADMTEGVLLEWLVHPGDAVRKGEIVAVVDTSKAAVEVECFDSGVVEGLLVAEGTRVPVGTALATIQSDATVDIKDRPPEVTIGRTAAAPHLPSAVDHDHVITSPLVRRLAREHHVDPQSVSGTGPGGHVTRADIERAVVEKAAAQGAASEPGTIEPGAVGHADAASPISPSRLRISPLARRVAAELGVDAATVTGTGPGGAISVDDVRRSTRPAAVAPTADRVAAMTTTAVGVAPTVDRTAAMRATIAAAMSRSKREIPHYYVRHTIDLGRATAWLRERNRKHSVTERLVPAALLIKAAALAAREVPQLNGFWRQDSFEPAPVVHVGVAVSLRGGGLVAPAVHDTCSLGLDEVMARVRDLVDRTRAGRLRASELADPTITVSNLGDQGVEEVYGVIYPPQVALVGFGAVLERPWAVNGLLGVRPLVVVSLSGDHRATDGATGARYLKTVERLLQTPEEL